MGRTSSTPATAPALNAVMERMAAIETRIQTLENIANQTSSAALAMGNPIGTGGGEANASSGRARAGLGRP